MLSRSMSTSNAVHDILPNASAAIAGKAVEVVGFVQGDNSRDTISLLISSLATLGLCVYSAVHLNLPPKGERSYWTLLRGLKWCVIGLFGPELVLYTAWRQFASAKQLCDEVREATISKRRESGEGSKSRVEKVSSNGPSLLEKPNHIQGCQRRRDFSPRHPRAQTSVDHRSWVLWHNGWHCHRSG